MSGTSVATFNVDFNRFPDSEAKIEVNNGDVFFQTNNESERVKFKTVLLMLKLHDLQRFIVSEFKFGKSNMTKFRYTICDFETAQYLKTTHYPLGTLRYNYYEYRLNEIVQSVQGKWEKQKSQTN